MDNDDKLKRFFEIAWKEKIANGDLLTVLVVCDKNDDGPGRDVRSELAPGNSPRATFGSVMRCIFQILAYGKKAKESHEPTTDIKNDGRVILIWDEKDGSKDSVLFDGLSESYLRDHVVFDRELQTMSLKK